MWPLLVWTGEYWFTLKAFMNHKCLPWDNKRKGEVKNKKTSNALKFFEKKPGITLDISLWYPVSGSLLSVTEWRLCRMTTTGDFEFYRFSLSLADRFWATFPLCFQSRAFSFHLSGHFASVICKGVSLWVLRGTFPWRLTPLFSLIEEEVPAVSQWGR